LSGVDRVLKGEEKSEVNKLAANILRVLVACHGVCWRTELPRDLRKFCVLMGRPDLLNLASLEGAIQLLKSEDVVIVEYRRRGRLLSKETYVDQLIKVKELDKVKKTLQSDKRFLQYRLKKREKLMRILRERGINP